jgi:hypothetical protein
MYNFCKKLRGGKMKSWKVLLALMLVPAVIWLSCSKDSTEPDDQITYLVQTDVGPAGALIMVPNQLIMIIGLNALDSTIHLTIRQNDSPTPIGGTKKFVSPVYRMEPSGVQFDPEAVLTLYYNENELSGVSENLVELYQNSGSGWFSLASSVNDSANFVVGPVEQLGDFAAVVDTSQQAAEGVYAKLIVARMITGSAGNPDKFDTYAASFDSAYAPCEPVQPLQVTSVTCNDTALIWVPQTGTYVYVDYMNPDMIVLGGEYIYEVVGNSMVPSLTDSVTFPSTEPMISNINDGDTVSLDGFNVNWIYSSGGGTIDIAIVSILGDSLVYVTTANDGGYTFSAAQLSGLSAGEYGFILNYYSRNYITKAGYDSRSEISARVMHAIEVYAE